MTPSHWGPHNALCASPLPSSNTAYQPCQSSRGYVHNPRSHIATLPTSHAKCPHTVPSHLPKNIYPAAIPQSLLVAACQVSLPPAISDVPPPALIYIRHPQASFTFPTHSPQIHPPPTGSPPALSYLLQKIFPATIPLSLLVVA